MKSVFFILAILLSTLPIVVLSAEISGTVTKQDTGETAFAGISLFDENHDYIGNLGTTDESGYYSFTGLTEGNYYLQVAAYDIEDRNYINAYEAVTIASSGNIFNVSLLLGGSIAGTVTTETTVNNPDNAPLSVDIVDENGEWVTWGFVDTMNPVEANAYPYISQGVPPGNYYVSFYDTEDQFQGKWYDNTANFWDGGQLVEVLTGSTTEDIDATLHEYSVADNRYYFSYTDLNTIYQYKEATGSTSSIVNSYGLLRKYSSNLPVPLGKFNTASVTAPSTSCTEPEKYIDTTWILQVSDQDDDGGTGDGILNRDDEIPTVKTWYDMGFTCDLSEFSPHEAGAYNVNTSFLDGGNGGTPLNRTITLSQGLTIAQLPPPTDLTVYWDDSTKELRSTWSMPEYEEGLTKYAQIRVYLYRRGLFNQRMVRVINLPTTLDSFILNEDLTLPFADGSADQIDVQIRVYGVNNTLARLRQSYDFDLTTGYLTPATIAAPPYDVNDDGKTGLAESIHILRTLTEQ